MSSATETKPCKLEPLGNRVVVEKIKTEVKEKTPGGIIIPSTIKEKPKYSRVVAVSPSQDTLVVGDVVIVANYAGTEIQTEDGDSFIVVSVEDVICKVNMRMLGDTECETT